MTGSGNAQIIKGCCGKLREGTRSTHGPPYPTPPALRTISAAYSSMNRPASRSSRAASALASVPAVGVSEGDASTAPVLPAAPLEGVETVRWRARAQEPTSRRRSGGPEGPEGRRSVREPGAGAVTPDWRTEARRESAWGYHTQP